MNISPRHLRIFLAIAQSLSFSRTAEQFFVTQPALSKAVKDLEDQLGLVLFERSTRKVKLTPAGLRLIPLAQRTVGEFDAGVRHMKDQAAREVQPLAVAALPSLASVLLPDACADLESRYPGIRIAVRDGTFEATLQRLLTYQVDFAVAASAPVDPQLCYEEILRDRFVALSSRRWHHRVKSETSLDDLLDLPLISMTDASTAMKLTSAAYLQKGVEFQPKYQFDQIGTIASFVARGLGVAVLPYLGVLPLLSLKGLSLSTVSDGPVRSIGILRRSASPMSVAAECAMSSIRSVAARLVEVSGDRVLPPRTA